VVLLQDHYKTPQLRDGKEELIITGLEVMRVLLAAGGKIEHLDVNQWPAVIPQYKREPVLVVEGVGEVLPSPVDVQVTTIGEHFHLPLGQALLIIQTKLEFPTTSGGLGHCSRQFLRAQRST